MFSSAGVDLCTGDGDGDVDKQMSGENEIGSNKNENGYKDKYAFLDEMEMETEEAYTDKVYTEDQVENWTLKELQEYLLTLSLTEMELNWLNETTKDMPCDTETDVMPYFKDIIKKRLTSGSGS